MRAWVAPRYGPPGVLRLQELPDPVPGRGQALVRVRALGLNFADCAARLGVYPRVPKAPFVPGMEVSGEVAALGKGVAGPPVGTPVAAVPIFGGHAELVAVDARFLRPLPPGVDFVNGAAIAVTGLTADHALFTVGRLRAGERVADHRGGGGRRARSRCRWRRRPAPACSRWRRRAPSAELAASLGAHETAAYEGYRAALAGGVDVVVDAVGGSLFRPGWKALNPDGRYVLYGFAAALGPGRVRYLHAALELLRMGAMIPSAFVQSTKSLSGFNLSLVPHLAGELQARFARIEAMLAAGSLRPVVGAVFPFERLPEAHAFLQSRASTGKVVVTL